MSAGRIIPGDAAAYLSLHHVITLSTSSFTGMPHADTTVYVSDHERLYFYAAPGTDLVRNITDSRHVSFTIDDYTTDWRKVRELQGVCRCQPAEEGERGRVSAYWRGKYGPTSTPTGILYSLTPLEMHFVDYDYDTVAAGAAPLMSAQDFVLNEGEEKPTGTPLATTLEQTSYPAGEVIFRPGDRAGHYYVVLSGEVEIRGEGHGSDQTVTRVGAGQMFGDQAALSGQRGEITAHAVSDTVLLALPRGTIRGLLRNSGAGTAPVD